jgi:hypothetical protein
VLTLARSVLRVVATQRQQSSLMQQRQRTPSALDDDDRPKAIASKHILTAWYYPVRTIRAGYAEFLKNQVAAIAPPAIAESSSLD